MQADQEDVVRRVNGSILAIILCAVVILVAALFMTASINSNLRLASQKFDDFDVDENAIANAVIANMTIPDYPEFPEYMITEEGYKEAKWEDEAIVLATEELEDDNYEVLADNSHGRFSEDDIIEVKIRDTEVSKTSWTFDVDDEDAVVWLKLRVYYEDDDSDRKIKTVYMETTIKDGEVTGTEFQHDEPYIF